MSQILHLCAGRSGGYDPDLEPTEYPTWSFPAHELEPMRPPVCDCGRCAAAYTAATGATS